MHHAIDDHRQTPTDDQGIADLLMLAFVAEGHASPENAARLTAAAELHRRGVIILARSPAPGERIIGMVILAEPTSPYRQIAGPDEAEVQLLAVHPDARGQGIGRTLLAACQDKASRRGYARMVLSTQPTMRAAHRVYELAGYSRNPTRDWRRPDGRGFLVYEKRLTAREQR
jgi:ribosomal protein S18 acetylase RimI-like enzyme